LQGLARGDRNATAAESRNNHYEKFVDDDRLPDDEPDGR